MKMNKAKRAQGHSSKVLGDLLKEITPKEQKRTESKMLLASRIDEARMALGWSQTKFAEEMGKQPSEICKWLSGTHNFTSETLWDIEDKLNIQLISLKEREWAPVLVEVYTVVVTSPALPRFAGLLEPFVSAPTKEKSLLASKTFAYG